jgi:hypothetical protein
MALVVTPCEHCNEYSACTRQSIYWPAERLSASHEGLCSMELICWLDVHKYLLHSCNDISELRVAYRLVLCNRCAANFYKKLHIRTL